MFMPARFRENKQTAVFILILILSSLLQYSLSFRNDFVWDAKGVFLVDPSIKSLDQIPRYFTEPSTLPAPEHIPRDSITMLKYYRPIMKSIHAIEHSIFGTDPLGYNTVNILANAAVVLLAFFFIRSATDNTVLAFVSSLFYAVNPTRVEVVSWAYSDPYILATLFTLLTLYLFRNGHLITSIGVFALSLFTHEMAVIIPLLVVLHEFLVRGRRTYDRYFSIAPFFVLLGMFLTIRRSVAGPLPLSDVGIFTFTNSVAIIVKRYVKIFFIPDAPVTTYIYTKGMFSTLSPEILLSYVAVAGLAMFAVYLWFRRKDYLFWYLWFFLFCALSFNVGQFGEYLMAERILYPASLGFCVLIAIPAVSSWRGKQLFAVLLAVIIVYHSFTTAIRQGYWKDTTTYLEEALKFAPDFAIGHIALAAEYQMLRDYDRALDESYKALALRPGLISVMPAHMANLYFLKGEALSDQGQYDNAMIEYQRALQWKVDHSRSLSNIGSIHHIQGKHKQAIESWLKAIKSEPANAVPYYNIGMALQAQGDIDASLEYYQKYLSLEQNPPPTAKHHIEELKKKRTR